MRYGALVFFLFLFLTACQSDKILLNNVTALSLETERNATLNVGSEFSYTIYATLKTGEVRKVKNDALISFPGETLQHTGNRKALISQPLTDFETTLMPIHLALEIGAYRVESRDSIALNFKGPIIADWSGANGRSGVQPRASAATLFGRDGLKGRDGSAGKQGEDGPQFTGYLWMDQNELRLLLISDSTQETYCYRSVAKDSIHIDLSGGDAGNGGQGGQGGDGKPAKTGKVAGNGADGGVGGNGGHGGDGGSLVLFIHPNAAYLNESIDLENSGGRGGLAGAGGVSGSPGTPLDGQRLGTAGEKGASGIPGENGKDGPQLTISEVAFDFEKILEE